MGFKKEGLLNDLLSKPSSTSDQKQKSCTSTKPAMNQIPMLISHHYTKTESESMGICDAAMESKDTKLSDQESNDNATGNQTPHDGDCCNEKHTGNINYDGMLKSSECNFVKEASLSKFLDSANTVPFSIPDEKTDGIEPYQDFNQIDCNSLEVPEKEVEIHSTAANSSCLYSHLNTDNTRDSSKLSEITSNVVPLPIDYNVPDSSHTADVKRPNRGGIVLTHGTKPHSDHDYCFENNISSQDQRYSHCPSEFSAASPNITWGLEYQPAYQVHSYQTYSASSVDMVQLNSSSCWYFNVATKEDLLKKIGLTQVNLEKLADTGNFNESLFSRENSRSSEHRSSRVKVRREVFIDAMQDIGDHKKVQHHNKMLLFNHTNLGKYVTLEKWMNFDKLGVEEMHCFLEEIIEIVYRIKDMQQMQLLSDQSTWHQQENGVNRNTQIHQKIHMHFAKSFDRKHMRSSVEWKLDDRETHTSPSVWERSRPVTNACSKKSNLTSLTTKHSPIATSATRVMVGEEESLTNGTGKSKQVKRARKSGEMNIERTLRSRTITLPTNKKKETLKKIQDSYMEKADFNPVPPPDEVSKSQNDYILSSREWTILSEKWINNPLDKKAMLQTLHDTVN